MNTSIMKTLIISLGIALISISDILAQEGTVTVNQSPEIDRLLDLKKDISIEKERFKISIFSGPRLGAEAAQANFREAYPQFSSIMEYETPNYKIYIGNFRSRLEADRALLKVKRKFTSAFILKPEN